MQNLIKKFRRANKGFTLVELIIVVAILAVLTGALVPQYLKYVEDTRISLDETYIKNVANAIKVAAASDEIVFGNRVQVRFTSTGALNMSQGQLQQRVEEEITRLIKKTDQKFVSNYYKGLNTDTVRVSIYEDGKMSIVGTKNINQNTSLDNGQKF